MKRTTLATSFLLLVLLVLFVLYFFKQKQLLIEKNYPVSDNNINQVDIERVKTHREMTHIDHRVTEQQKENVAREYIIKNSITSDMLAYKHWSGSYTPTTFAVSVQGTLIQPGETFSILANSTMPVKIRYDYSFLKGYRTGSKEIAFVPLKEAGILDLTFSWHEPSHLILKDAKIVGETELPFDTSLETTDTNKI